MRRALTILVFIMIIFSIFALIFSITSIPEYVKENDTMQIKFAVSDANVDNNVKQLIAKVYYSTSSGSFENLIDTYNLSTGNYCVDKNFLDSTECTVTWTVNITNTARYYIDINVFIDQNANILDVNVTSAPFNVDNTAPQISVLFPENVACNSASVVDTNVQRIVFRVIDSNALDSNSIKVYVQATQSSYFSLEKCDYNVTSASCDYNELSMRINGQSYSYKIQASDTVSNSTVCEFILKYIDVTPPAQVKNVWSEAITGGIKLHWQANTESDLNGYKVYYSTHSCDFNKDTANYAGFTTDTVFELKDLNSDLNYYMRVSAIDYSGNESTLSDCEIRKPLPKEAPQAPQLTSSTHSNDVWTTKDDVIITWNAVEGATGYSCTWGTTCDDPDATIDSSLNWCQNRKLEQTNLGDGIYCLKVRACAENNLCSSVVTFKVKIDTDAPSRPKNLSADVLSGPKVKLDWSASSDDLSGVKRYRIYRSTKEDFDIDPDYLLDTTTDTEYTDDEVKKNKTYYYKVVAEDYAGNLSIAAFISVKVGEISASIDVPAYVPAGELEIKVEATDTLDNAYLYIKLPGSTTWQKIYGPKDLMEFKVSYEVEEGSDGVAELKLVADNLEDDVVKSFEIDTEAPKITWHAPEEDATLYGVADINIELDEPSTRIAKVEFYIDDSKVKTLYSATSKGIFWSFDYNFAKLSEGKHTIKVLARDKAGNESTEEITIEVRSPKTIVRENTLSKLNSLKTLSVEAQNIISRLKKYKLPFKDAGLLFEDANKFINDAENAFSSEDYNKALSLAEKANKLLSELKEKFTVRIEFDKESFVDKNALIYSSQEFELNKEQLKYLYTTNVTVSRKITVFSVGSGANAKYYLRYYITVSGIDTNYRLVVNVPKELANNASLIEATVPFDIVKDDPIIAFNVLSDTNIFTVEYTITEPLDKNTYTTLKSAGVLEASKIAIIPVLPAKPLDASVIILTIFIIAILIAAGFFAYSWKHRKEPVVEASPLEAAIHRIERMFPRKPKIEEKPKKKRRWQYVGE